MIIEREERQQLYFFFEALGLAVVAFFFHHLIYIYESLALGQGSGEQVCGQHPATYFFLLSIGPKSFGGGGEEHPAPCTSSVPPYMCCM
jgi:hypothetical protein